jgi:hypothetical protein
MSSPQTGFAVAPPAGMAGDMKFVGTFSLIYGALVCLSIIGALVGIPLIVAGIRLRESGEAYAAVPMGDPTALSRAYSGQASYFRILKILMIVALVLIACEIVFIFFMGGLAFLHRSSFAS